MAAATGTHSEILHEKAPFPPLQKEHFPSQLFWLAVCFIALYLIASRIALPRIAVILEERRRRIDGDLAEAQRLKGESDLAAEAHEKALAEARGLAQTLANEARERTVAAGESRRKDIEQQLNERIADAERSIAAGRAAAMTNVRSIASDAAGAIVERLTGIKPASSEIDQAVATALEH